MDFDVISKFLPLNVLILAIGVYFLSLVVKKIADPKVSKATMKRFLPLVPLVFGVGISFVPGVFPGLTIGGQIVNGLLATFAAAYLHEIVKKVFLGKFEIQDILTPDEDEEKKPEA